VETIEQYLTNLRLDAPVPGGGSAATVVTACGAALVGMVARICARSPKYAVHAELTEALAAAGDALVGELSALRIRDENAFAAVVEAQALPKSTLEQQAARGRALERSLQEAAAAPLATAAAALQVVRCAAQLLEIGNRHLASDAGCAAEFGSAGLTACAYNVRVNHRYMHDATAIALQETTLVRYENEAAEKLAAVRAAVGAILAPPG
jgi:glutamate formiminotransferase/formiminotetrahydrofolate cyclodeaminase